MAAASSPIGSATAGAEHESAAQKLMEKHAADEAHNVTIEDVVDEEDAETSTPSAGLSDVVKGKQKAEDTPAPTKSKVPNFDVTSNEAFPALGGPKSIPAAAPQKWGQAKVTPVNGSGGISNGTARASTPAAGPPGATPKAGPPGVSIPGQHKEAVRVPPEFILPRQQLKRPLPEVIRDVNRRSKANVSMKDGNDGGKIFEGQGPADAVRQALKEVMQQIGAKQTRTVDIPISVRSHIIGRQGATIQDISKKTGAKVQMPKQDSLPSGPDDDDILIPVTLEGDFFALGHARQLIEKIVDERSSNTTTRLKDIPAEYYPFIAGPNNSRIEQFENGREIKINVPHYHTWRDSAPSQSGASGQPVVFVPQPSLPISISGDRRQAAEARAEIDQLVKSLQRSLVLDQTPIDKGRHQFIVGDRGSSAHDFLAETGCALIKPPPGVDDDTLYVVGPSDKLQGGIDKVMELASQMQQMNVDVAKPHSSARGGGHEHARNVTRYLKQREALEELERLHNASVVLPNLEDGPTNWEVYAKDFKNATKARQDILNLITAHPPSRFQSLQIDPFFHETLRQRQAPSIRHEHGVHIVFPDGHSGSPDLLLVYEQPGSPSEYVIPRQASSATEAKEHEKTIRQVQRELLALVAAQQAIESIQLEAATKYHEKVRRFVDKTQQDLPHDQFPVQLLFGQQGRPAAQRAPNSFSIRGPSSAVNDLNAQILAFLDQEKADEAERGFKLQFDYPQKYANHLIGKRGENINRLKVEYDVDIQVKDGKVELTGPEKKCNACKSHVLSQLKKLEDETTHVLKIKSQYHRDLIGPKGSQVNRLQDRYNVRVNFPRSTPIDDNASEIGSVRNARNQAPDEVVVKGPKKGADEAREELLNLYQYVMDNSNAATLSVQQAQIPSLIGTGGREMDKLRLETGCAIDVPSARDGADADGRVEIKLRGTKSAVENAKKLLQERVKTFDETVTRSVEVDKKHHRNLIGAGGANIRKIVLDAGGPDDSRSIARMVRFPKPGDSDTAIRVEGSKSIVDKIVSAIESQAKSRDDQVIEHLDIPTEKHRLLIGRGGETRRGLEQKFNIQLDVPKQDSKDTKIKLSGLPSDVGSARAHIENLVKDQEGAKLDVPRKHHHAISENGRVFRRFRDDHGVTIDHAGQQPPPRPATRGARRNVNGNNNMPLITDDASAGADSHSWELVDNSSLYSDEDGDDTIPWILRGNNADKVAKAKSQLEASLAKAEQPSWTGYLILPDAKGYGRIIGPGGSQINSIKKKTGCDVQVPRAQRGGEAVEISGSKDGVEEARDIILGIIKDAGNDMGSRGGSRRG